MEINLLEMLENKGLEKNMLNNPAFGKIIDKVLLSILRSDKTDVIEEYGRTKILLNDKYNGDEVNLIVYVGADHKSLKINSYTKRENRNVFANSLNVVLNKHNDIEVIDNYCEVRENLENPGTCMLTSTLTEKSYNSFGMEMKYVFITNKDEPVTVPLRDINNPFAFQVSNNGSSKVILQREYYDTARYIIKNESDNIIFSASVLLSDINGFQEMTPDGEVFDQSYGLEPYRKLIFKKHKSVIDSQIADEKNEEVKLGLKMFSRNRENYEYMAINDSDFVNELQKYNNELAR